MTCDQAQEAVSMALDGERPLPKAAEDHLSTCPGCLEFRWDVGRFELWYRGRVRAGIDRLRPSDGRSSLDGSGADRRKACPARWLAALAALAAAGSFCLCDGLPASLSKSPTAFIPNQASLAAVPGHWPRSLLDGVPPSADPEFSLGTEDGLAMTLEDRTLPLHLDQDPGPSRAADPEPALPVSLKF